MPHCLFLEDFAGSGIKFSLYKGRAGSSPAFCFVWVQMTLEKNKSGIFFGWRTVITTGIVSGLGLGIYMYGISALFKPIAAELGLSRAAASGATGIGFMIGSLFSPATGWIVDKFGPKLSIIAGLILSILGLALMRFVITGWQFYLVWGVLIGTGVFWGFTVAIDKSLNDWFEKKIGLAMGVRFAFLGLTGAVSLPLISWLISAVGWRMTCLLWAGILAIGLPFILLYVKNQRPEHYGLRPDGNQIDTLLESGATTLNEKNSHSAAAEFQREGFSFRQAIKTSAFWMLAVSYISQFFITAGFNTHCIPFLTEMNIDPIIAGSMMGIMIVFTIPSRFLCGVFADRIPKDRLKLLMALPFLILLFGIVIFLINPSTLSIYILLFFYGLAHGLPTPLLIIIISRYFGRKAFGAILGSCVMFLVPAALFSPIIAGWIFDKTGSYNIAFQLFAATALCAAILLCFMRTPKLLN
jgi:cyanate permease